MASKYAAYSATTAKFLFVEQDLDRTREGAVKCHFLNDDSLIFVYAIPEERRAPDLIAEAREIGREVFRGANVPASYQ